MGTVVLASFLIIFLVVFTIIYVTPEYEWICPDTITYEQREEKVLECITNSRKGVASCRIDVNSFYCDRRKKE